MAEARSARMDHVVGGLAWGAALAIAACFTWIIWDMIVQGIGLIDFDFLTREPRDAGRAGGIGTILVSTGLIVGVCLVVAVPLGIATAAWLSELAPGAGRASRAVRTSLDLLASVPSIVFGLFGMVFFCQVLGMGFSILAGGMTLACMVLPLVVRTTYAGLRGAPDDLRLGGAALGLTRTATLRHLLLPAAFHGAVIGIILALGRAMSETAALIFTSGYVTRMPESLLDSGRSLSVHIYDLAMNVAGGESNAHATALALLVLLLLINLSASRLAAVWLEARQRS